MSEKEIKDKITELERFIEKQELRRAQNVMLMIVSVLSILGGGLLLGWLFDSLAKLMILAVGFAALPFIDTAKEIGEANDEIKRCNNQIDIYNRQIDSNGNNKSNTVTKQEVKEKKEEKEVKKDYSYKPENNKKKPEIKIERFTEEDFLDDDKPKSR